MKKLIPAAIGIAVLGLGGYVALVAMASPETKIRWRLEEMAEDFNLARPGPCSRGLADDFLDETAGVGRQEVRGFLTRLVFVERDQETKKFLYRVVLPRDDMKVTIDAADPARARVEVVATFERFEKDAWSLAWKVSVTAELADGDEGWQVLRSTHETIAGTRFR